MIIIIIKIVIAKVLTVRILTTKRTRATTSKSPPRDVRSS